MSNIQQPSLAADRSRLSTRISTAPASNAVAAVIEAGARLFIAQPWRVARIVRGADAMTARELCAHVARRRRVGPPADLNLAIALAQLSLALQAPAFDAAWADWRPRKGRQNRRRLFRSPLFSQRLLRLYGARRALETGRAVLRSRFYARPGSIRSWSGSKCPLKGIAIVRQPFAPARPRRRRPSRPLRVGMRLQHHSDGGGGRQGAMGGSAEPVSAARRSDPQSGRDRAGLRQAGKGRADRRHRGARQGDRDPCRRLRSSPIRTRSSNWRTRRTRCPARSDACWRSARIIPTSNRTRTSSRCRRSWRAPKTASPSRAGIISTRCAPTTPRCARFPTVLWAATFFRSNKPMAEFTATDEAQTPPKVKF